MSYRRSPKSQYQRLVSTRHPIGQRQLNIHPRKQRTDWGSQPKDTIGVEWGEAVTNKTSGYFIIVRDRYKGEDRTYPFAQLGHYQYNHVPVVFETRQDAEDWAAEYMAQEAEDQARRKRPSKHPTTFEAASFKDWKLLPVKSLGAKEGEIGYPEYKDGFFIYGWTVERR
jgi:hypothetical protein